MITSTRTMVVTLRGDGIDTTITSLAAINTTAPGDSWILDAFTGDEVITVPKVVGVSVPTAVTIVPPIGNTQLLKLKKVAGDTGVLIHKTDPTCIALDPTETSFIINSGGAVTGLRIIWS